MKLFLDGYNQLFLDGYNQLFWMGIEVRQPLALSLELLVPLR